MRIHAGSLSFLIRLMCVASVLWACTSSPEPPRGAEPLPGSSGHLEWMARLVETEPARVLNLCYGMDPLIREASGAAWASLVSSAVGRLGAIAREAAAASDWMRVHEAMRNLRFLAEGAGSWPEAAGAIEPGILDEWPEKKILEAWADASERSGAFSLAEHLRSLSPETDSDPAPEAASIPDMLPGVCTIWVNKGLKSEGGMAVADRVIGSGFFIDRKGYLITNYHVIESEVDPAYEGYSRLYVRMPTSMEERIPARVVGWDRTIDIALLKTQVEPDYVFSLRSRRSFRPGDRVYAIGSPLGLESTVNSGIVSAVDREILPLAQAIQVDVAVNPGNSGGPLLDAEGRMAGVIFAGLPDYQGLNFAIDARTVASRLPSLFAGGDSARGFAGLGLAELGGRLEVIYVMPGSAAAEAGIREGDFLLSLDGRPVSRLREFRGLFAELDSGRLAQLGTEREGRRVDRLLDIRKRPWLPIEPLLRKEPRQRLLPLLFGMKVERVRRTLLEDGYTLSAVIPGSAADEMGLSEGDPIALKGWLVDKEQEAVFIQLYVKRRKQGFLEAIIQMGVSYSLLPLL